MVNAKKKGNAGENRFANWLHSRGIKAHKEASSGARWSKGDIVNSIDCTIEVKTVKKLNLHEAWKQVTGDASLARNQPLLAVHFDGMPQDEWIICIHSEDWLAHVTAEHNSQDVLENDPRKKYAIQNLVESAKRVLKLLEQ